MVLLNEIEVGIYEKFAKGNVTVISRKKYVSQQLCSE